MTKTDLRSTQLDRAHLQGKVIASGLQHLAVVLTAEPELRDDLASFSSRFVAYVRRLDQASIAAARARGETPHSDEV